MQVLDDPHQPVFSISTAAQLLHVSPQTLRQYEAEGLILPARPNGNQRKYSQNDLERLQCLREALKEHKLTIPAIKRILALIPCWDIVGCADEDRQHCPAYGGHEKPCWSYTHTDSICASRECRGCPVYQLASDCDQIKSSIIRSTQRHIKRE